MEGYKVCVYAIAKDEAKFAARWAESMGQDISRMPHLPQIPLALQVHAPVPRGWQLRRP